MPMVARIFIVVSFLVAGLAPSTGAQASTWSGCQASIGMRFGVSPAPSEADPYYTASCNLRYPATSSQGRGVVEGWVVPPGTTFARGLKFTYVDSPYGDATAIGTQWAYAVWIDGVVASSGTAVEKLDTSVSVPARGGEVKAAIFPLSPTAPASNINIQFYAHGHTYSKNYGRGSAYCGPAGADGGLPLPC